MNSKLAAQRIIRQGLSHPQFSDPVSVVKHMAGIQAQDFEMAKWAVGIRMQNPDLEAINAALDSAKIIRAHIFRPTWHLVTGEDYWWMNRFSAPFLRKGHTGRFQQLGLNETLLQKTRKLIHKSLLARPSLTRQQILEVFQSHKFKPDPQQLNHILYDAELEGLICSGPQQGKTHSYTLVEQRLPSPVGKTAEEALAELTIRYFKSHGPATLQDLTKWMNIPVNTARLGIEMNRSSLDFQTINGKVHWFTDHPEPARSRPRPFLLLPAYDEYLIGYADRSFAIQPEFIPVVMTSNGILHPTLVYRGKVLGLWKRKPGSKVQEVQSNWFFKPNQSQRSLFKQSIGLYQRFYRRH